MIRKNLFILTVIATIGILQPGYAFAASAPRAMLETTVNRVLDELKKPELKAPATRDTVLKRVEIIIVELFSMEEVSMRTVGPNWRTFSQEQKNRFKDAFEDLLRERYLNALKDYNGETVTYLKETQVGSAGDKMQIDTQIKMKDKLVPMSYRMINKNSWKVYDVLIEGVSLVQNYRSQFQSVLQRNDVEELIILVQKKAQETKDQNAK